MIPKIIHYCWFSNDPKPALIKKCIKSWEKHLPGYEIRCWGGDSFDFNLIPFTKEAISVKQYAAAADYVRLYALYHFGGIYLDSDVEVLQPLDSFLDNKFFTGIERSSNGEDQRDQIEAGIMGSEKGFPFLKECMSYFENTHFIHEDGTFDNAKIVAPEIYTMPARKYGFEACDKEQILSNGIHIYPRNMIANGDYIYTYNKIDYSNLFAIHHNMNSWDLSRAPRGKFWQFCYKHDLMDTYRNIESFRIHLRQWMSTNKEK